MRKKKKKSNNLKFALYFIILVIFFGGLSLSFKLGLVLKNSSFDNNHRYNLELRKGQISCVASFSPQTNSISIVNIDGRVEGSLNKAISIPIDAKTLGSCPINESSIFSTLVGIFPNTFKVDSSPTFIDVLRLMIFVKSISEESILEERISVSLDDSLKQQVLSPLFLDQSIISEKKTIEIINSTDIPGLGARLAILLNNIGANIVLVITSEKGEKESQITYFGKDSYTVGKLSSILDFKKVKKEGKSIADVIIVIGKDQENTLKF
ncbi:MAG: hypothetical protein A2W22_02120 [Candidatus Levybacteria bacterium RBG_16_35_11]|nr:MAG: hypothetical protein A2W22_02120 [Candidatus Levybacteria bacterium RBG_16_35_11]